jgi:nucleotide-binding universal stress UspA family protein
MPSAPDAFELERRAREHGWDRDSWTIVHDVDAADGILQHAARLDDPLVVMASDGRAPWSSTIVGSVAHDVLRRTDRPVLLIGPHVPWWWAPETTTLMPCVEHVDASRTIDPIVRWQHTFDARPPRLAEVIADGESAASAQQHLEQMATLLAAQGVHADVELLHGDDPVRALELAADGLLGAVFVAASARYTDGRLHWHSTTRELVHRATRPVLVVPARPAPLRLRADPAPTEHVAFRDLSISGTDPAIDRPDSMGPLAGVVAAVAAGGPVRESRLR